MTLIAGIWYAGGIDLGDDLRRFAEGMLVAQGGVSDHPATIDADGSITFAVSGESGSDPMRYTHRLRTTDGGLPLIAVDARVDNRGELFDALGLPREDNIADETLVGLAYWRWGERLVDRLLGDYAIAAWEPQRQALTLIRDPTGQRPLHYRLANGMVAFASMPQGLFAAGPQPAVDVARLSSFVADIRPPGPETYFAGICRVEPAQIVRIDRGGVRRETYWHMPTAELRYADDRDYAIALREQLDRATSVRLRGGDKVVAAHLSAGLDSGAVVATAARLLAPHERRLLAITAAPRTDFAGPVPAGRIADESGLAALVAARCPNIDHLILRAGRGSPLDYLQEDAALFAQPVGHPCNNVWWRDVNAAARARGAAVMLTGEMGNLTISAGSLHILADLIRQGRPGDWLRQVVALRGGGGPRWRGLMAASFAPWLRNDVMAALSRLSAGGRVARPGQLRLYAAGTQPDAPATKLHATDREQRWAVLMAADSGNFRKGALLRWGIDERDPTSDRRLIEFCFTLPPTQLLRNGRTRGLARIAMADRLPPEIIEGVRGYQYADWFEAIDRDHLMTVARRIAASPAAAAAIDLDAVERLIAAWPPGDWASTITITTYRVALLRALAAGAFALNVGP